ncbi:ATP-binding cassette domain-containing protein [Sulfitobacter albidus]|uniref:ATP-binding cassette domain-containing protein n=1 Tax=Sulfitobacter albidus TaxID=2829501 RepID=A0A975JGT9_9RHOB|nr:ATP-binding cassette domain-containing protein [Sulfitobacter albidus]QUJ78264.1 ATP-binding cassette domain-containing protein [Sulfitobacter albidus]
MTATGVTVRKRGKALLGPLDLTIAKPQTTVVMGPNGSGKTTLLRVLHGLARLGEGRIDWTCDARTARAAQAFVFQRPILLRRSVLENLSYPLHIIGDPEATRKARDWAERVGLAPMLGRSALSLSGGEQQKLALARALITDPALIFLDEPTAALDGHATREIEALLSDARARGTALMLATHDLGQARRLADEVVFVLHGRAHEHAPAPAFFAQPASPEARAFLKGDIVA